MRWKRNPDPNGPSKGGRIKCQNQSWQPYNRSNMRQILVRSSGTLPETQGFSKIPLYYEDDAGSIKIDGPTAIQAELDIKCLNEQEFRTIGFHPSVPYALAAQGIVFCGANFDRANGIITVTLSSTGKAVSITKEQSFLILNLYDKISISHIGDEYDVYGSVVQLDSKEQ